MVDIARASVFTKDRNDLDRPRRPALHELCIKIQPSANYADVTFVSDIARPCAYCRLLLMPSSVGVNINDFC